MSSQLQVTGEAKIRDIQGPVVANDGVITALDGAASQYVRGDGTLADFPTSTGGGSSVSYYLNSSVSQGTIGGVAYRELSKDPIIGAGTDITISANGYVASYITDANDPDVVIVPGGNFNCEFYFSVNNNTGNPNTYAELYKYDGTTFTLLGSSVGVPEYINQGTIIAPYYFAIPVPTSALATTDRLAIRIYVNVDGRTVTLHTENSHLCQVVTTLSKGMTSLNNLTDQSQYLTTGTSGTNFAIVSTGDTHTFNLPVASASNTGKLSSTDWSTFNNKQNALTNPITGTGASGNVAYFDGTTSITAENSFNYDASTNRLGVNTTVPNATIGANAGTDSGYSLLLKNDNANYNGIGFATTSTYGNVIGTEKLGTAPARNLTLLNQSGYISITEVGNLGVNILNPNAGIDIYNSTSSQLWLHTANSGISATDGVRLALFSNNGANLRNFEGAMSITSEGDFQVITLGAENIRVNSADGKVGIGNPTTVSEMLTVNGSIQQSGVLSALLKTNSTGKIIAAVAGTDYVVPSALSGYVPTSRTLTINGTAYDLSADRSWSVGTTTGSGADGRVAYWNGANSITSEAGFIYDSSTNRLGVNTSVPNATIGADAALNSGYGLLIKTGASDYNGIGIAIDSTYGNTIETAKLGTASARNLTLLNQSGYVSLTESGAFGVGILSPNVGIDIYNSTQSQLWLHNAATGITATDGVRLALFNSKEANLRNFDGGLSITAEGNFSIITLGADNFRINSANGYIGIGDPATILAQLHIYNASAAASMLVQTNSSTDYSEIAVRNASSVATSYFRQYSASASGTDFGLSRSNLATFFSNFASNFAIGTQNGGDLIFGTANTERARITDAGNFGIGTTSNISATLTVFSSTEANQIKIGGAAPATVYADSLSTATYIGVIGLATASNNFANGIVPGDFVIGTQKNTPIVFITGTSTSQKMRLTNAGDLGIGTSAPDTKLDVRGEISLAYSASNGLRFYNQDRSNWSSISNTNTTTNANLVFRTSAGVALTLNNNRDAAFTTNITANNKITTGSGAFRNGGFYIPYSSASTSSRTWAMTNDELAFGDFAILQSSTQTGGIDTYRLYISPTGNVGIGTSSPIALLNIYGSNHLQLQNATTGSGATDGTRITLSGSDLQIINRETADTIFYTTDTERMRITSGGGVGIAVTPSNWLTSTVAALQVKNSSFAGYSQGGVHINYVGSNWYYDNSGGGTDRYISNGFASIFTQANGEFNWVTAPSGTAGNPITFTPVMRITSGGNVGIGVSAPTYKLQVSGNTYLLGASSGSGDFALVVQNSSSNNMLLVRNDKAVFAQGIYDFTTGSGANVVVFSDGSMQRSTSSLKYKKNVENYSKGLAEVMQMRPVSYNSKNENETQTYAGLIAEEVHELGLTEFVQYADDGTPDALSYSNMVSLLVKAIQEQQAKIEELKAKTNRLFRDHYGEQIINELKNK